MTDIIRVTRKQRENLLDAMNVMWPSVPEANVYPKLDYWRRIVALSDKYQAPDSEPTCNTVACFGGWCTWWPAFQEQGIKVSPNGAPQTQEGDNFLLVSRLLFGHDRMFHPRGDHPADGPFMGTDHQLVTRRLRWLLRNSEVISEVAS